MLQVDATVGHWYSKSIAKRIETSPSSAPRIFKLLRHLSAWLDRSEGNVEFYSIEQPEELPVYVAACVIRRPRTFPALMIGHGVAFDLERAMYRALYEAIPILLVSQIQTVRKMYGDPSPDETSLSKPSVSIRELFSELRTDRVTDLETAVAYYALPENAEKLFPGRFNPDQMVTSTEIYERIPPIWKGLSAVLQIEAMLRAIMRHFRIFAMDLTAPDTEKLGLRVTRFFSPDLLSLPIPSFPEAAHPRFSAYGGFRSTEPHPYP